MSRGVGLGVVEEVDERGGDEVETILLFFFSWLLYPSSEMKLF